MASSVAPDPPLESLLDGHWITLADARCFTSEHCYPQQFLHGGLPLARALAVPAGVWSPFALVSDGQVLDLGQALFIDVETTGLARDGGTYAFLAGVGFFAEEGFIVRQYLMPDYTEEEALLELLGRDLAAHRGLVSFNGRCFDWPIIETRYVLARRAVPFDGAPHLDLLSLARRLWQRTLPSCALSALEASILGIRRSEDDVPGYLIPQLYQDYVRWGRTRPMVRVFYHNLMDILAMVALAARMGQILHAPLSPEAGRCCDYLSMGALLEHTDRLPEAIEVYQMAARLDQPIAAEASKRLSFLLKRLGRYEEAMALWAQQLGGPEIYPYVELAKQFEHRLRDYASARRVVQQALASSGDQTPLNPQERRCLVAELEHRLARLERRLAAEETSTT